jgi:hypothetical protein
MDARIEAPMPRLRAVEPAGDLQVRVTWKKGPRSSRTEVIDLAPLVRSLKFYKPLRNDRALFNTVHLIESGSGIAWGNNDEIDMAATSLERLAEETFTADDFRLFLKSNDLTHEQAASQLGYTRRQIENFLSKAQPIPRVVVLACYGYSARRDHTKVDGVLKARRSQADSRKKSKRHR